MTSRIGAGLAAALMALAATAQKPVAPPVTSSSPLFESKIRPLLISSCVVCHSKESAQGGLRLDAPVTPEKAQEIVQRVRGEGGKPRMPLGSTLPPDKIAALEAWVRSGAKWGSTSAASAPSLMERGKSHWAFQPLKPVAIPRIRTTQVDINPIDAFVRKRLEAKGLKPSPPASRRELIRRVTYDLIGLPPTPEEVAAFEADKSPDAYEKVVDRLLASPHYGEQWARHWLDLVRYAETNSYERDNPKPYVTKYRDYVIRAFNADKPYNRFVREQIAGDELPDGNGDALAATAYYRLGIWDDEPADLKQAEYDDLDDLVATTGQAFLGLTLDCARCHDHKLDPIPQKDYYRFAALFHGINRFKNGGPTDEANYFATQAQKRDWEQKTTAHDAAAKANTAKMTAVESTWRQKRGQLVHPGDITELRYRYFQEAWSKFPDFDALKPVSAGLLASGLLDIGSRKRDENIGFVFEGILNVPTDGDYTFYLDTDDGSRLTVGGHSLLEKGGGGQGNEMRAVLHLPAGRVPFRVDYFQGVGPFGFSFAWGGPGFVRRPLSTYESCGASGLPVLIAAELPSLIGPAKAATYAEWAKEKERLDKQTFPVERVLAVTEVGPKAPDTFVLMRGNPATPGEKVEPGFPICAGGSASVVPAPAPEAHSTGRRLALANWLTSPENPLTARVIVNRIWQQHFGRGIVRTASDFGLQGMPPTHPELLDWLAGKFIAQNWSFKALHRLILTSETYKQASRANAAGLAADPQNDWFWRFDMRRLSAEEIRDSILAVSGNLNPAMFGPSVYPEIPKEILAGQSIPGADWHTETMKPEDMNRRSLYIHVKRSLIFPMLASFDLPETDRTVPARFTSTQPTQALGLMNNPWVNRQAALLATQVKKSVGGEPKVFSRRLLELTLQRLPTTQELVECIRLLARLEKRGAKPEQAQAYLALMALNLNGFMYLD